MLTQLLIVLVAFIALFVVVLFIRWKFSFRVLEKYGIKGPTPVLYYGNYKQITTMGYLEFIDLNLRNYGKLFGYYAGIQPIIVVRDLEMLKQILVKQFDDFMDRQHLPVFMSFVTSTKDSKEEHTLFQSRGQDWKRQRRIISKSFNAVKLKKMSPLIEKSCFALLENLNNHVSNSRGSFDIWRLYGRYTLEVILATAFGHRADVINGEADELAEASASVFIHIKGAELFTMTLFSNFPFLKGFFASFTAQTKLVKNLRYIAERATELMQSRVQEKDGVKYQDLLQLLMDAKADFDDEEMEHHEQQISNDIHKGQLTDVEIVKTIVAFLLAGYETTSNALAYTSYLLALHPEEQEKIFQEIDEFYSNHPEATLYEASQSLVYIDMVIQESLRMYPPAPVYGRHTLNETMVNGQVFPKDSMVVVPVLNIHHSPDIWPEPLTFRPERFTKEEKEKRHQLAHMPFGWGPRSCIGMRLALIEAKMALIAIMKEYKFIETPDTEKPLKVSLSITMAPVNGIYLNVARRVG